MSEGDATSRTSYKELCGREGRGCPVSCPYLREEEKEMRKAVAGSSEIAGSVRTLLGKAAAALPAVSASSWGRRNASTYFAGSTLTGRRALPMRIRPAVGDQAKDARDLFSKKEAEEDIEKDSDWIKVQEYVKRLNPSILTAAQQAVQDSAQKWVGEGVEQDSFQGACVSCARAVTVTCSSPGVSESVGKVLEILGGKRVDGAAAAAAASGGRGVGSNGLEAEGSADCIVDIGGTLIVVESASLRQGWVNTAMGMFRSKGDFARLSSVEFGADDGEEAKEQLESRGISTSPLRSGRGISLRGWKGSKGWALASPQSGSVLPASFRLVAASSSSSSSSSVSPGNAGIKLQEIAMGVSWEEHAAAQRMFDRVCGRGGMAAPGLWKLTGGHYLRAFPTDESGLKAIVLKVDSIEESKAALASAGVAVAPFPGYSSVLGCHGLDVRITEESESSKFFSEVRWEVEDATGSLRQNSGAAGARRESTSCIGAVTHGAAQRLSRGR